MSILRMRFREKGKTHLVTLDLFTDIAGITRALEGICVPAAYCDISESTRITLRRLMQKGGIPRAHISPDVTSLDKNWIQQNCDPRTQKIDMIVAGFPCIGFSPVGLRKGFENLLKPPKLLVPAHSPIDRRNPLSDGFSGKRA